MTEQSKTTKGNFGVPHGKARAELLPCPFCGETRALKLTTAEELANEGEDDPLPWQHSESWAVICDGSKPLGPGGCGGSGGFMPSAEQAVDLWNKRAPPPPPTTEGTPNEPKQKGGA